MAVAADLLDLCDLLVAVVDRPVVEDLLEVAVEVAGNSIFNSD